MSNAATTPLFNRPDTLLGICEGIGREFGFHPNILRVALAIPLVWNPLIAIGVYLALGVALLISHLVMPTRRDTPTVVREPIVHEQEIALAA